MQMAVVTIKCAPPDRKDPLQLLSLPVCTAAVAIELADIHWGPGELKNSQGVHIIFNPMWYLEAGEYYYEVGGKSPSRLAAC